MRVAIIINPVAGGRARGGTAGQRVDLARRLLPFHVDREPHEGGARSLEARVLPSALTVRC